jgi:hypothetical protein
LKNRKRKTVKAKQPPKPSPPTQLHRFGFFNVENIRIVRPHEIR